MITLVRDDNWFTQYLPPPSPLWFELYVTHQFFEFILYFCKVITSLPKIYVYAKCEEKSEQLKKYAN